MKNKIKYFFVLVLCCFAVSAFSQTVALSKDDLLNQQNLQEGEVLKSFTTSVQTAMSNPDYLVTPGDIYSLNYAAGTTPVSYAISVDTTYKVRVSNLAVLDAQGKTFVELKKEVENVVTKNYPLSGVQFVLMSPATFTVVVKGEVKQTEERSAWALSRLSSVLSGVYTDYSSNRFVTLKRADGTVKKCDLFLASRFGDLTQDPYLQPGDIIEIPRLEKKVTISGAIERPGTYELRENENLVELINYYGSGLTDFSDLSRVEITKPSVKENVKGEKIYLNIESLDDDLAKNQKLNNRESVFIGSYESMNPVIFIEGAILKNTEISSGTELTATEKVTMKFNPGENYAFFVRNNSSIFSSVSDLENAYIIRKGDILPIDINECLYDVSYYSDLFLEENDVLMIPFKQFFVTVAGAVNNPGRFAYIPDRSYEYYIGLAGGFDSDRNTNGAVEIKDVNGKKQSKNGEIEPEDTITAKTNSFTYFFNKYATVLTTILSIVSTFLSVQVMVGR